jgi:hypothetical protein
MFGSWVSLNSKCAASANAKPEASQGAKLFLRNRDLNFFYSTTTILSKLNNTLDRPSGSSYYLPDMYCILPSSIWSCNVIHIV